MTSLGSKHMVDKMKEVLGIFCIAMGVIMNTSKSMEICWGLYEPKKLYINNIFPFMFSPFEIVFKYLGFHLKSKLYLKEDWKWLLDKIEKKWKFGAIDGSHAVVN